MSQTTAPDVWVSVVCTSPVCLKACPGGRVLFRRKGQLVSVMRRGQGLIVAGIPLTWVCRCGAIWKNQELASLFETADALGDLGA